MASGNITTRTALTTPQPTMLLYAALDPFGTTDDRKILANDLFAEITANITDLSVQFGNGSSSTVSAANKGKIRYLDGTGFQVSENGAAYATITSLGNSVTGTGAIVRATSPTLVTPALGTPTALVLTNATGLPVATGISGLGSGVASALAVNTGSNGAIVLFNGAAGTPSSLTLTNATGLLPVAGIVGWPANAAGVLTNDGSGTLSWGAGGSTSPGGLTTNAQYNSAGSFAGSTGITFTATQATITGAKFVGSLRDSNDNILIAPTATASAVNYFTLANSATLNPLTVTASGSDTNISIQLIPKGTDATSGGQLVVPSNRRYNRPGITFDGASTEYGLGMDGTYWFLINAGSIGLGTGDGLTEGFVALNGHSYLAWGASTATPKDDPPGQDLFIGRRAAATFLFGKADVAAPVAQIFTFQGVAAGTSNTAGVNTTWRGSVSTGNASGGGFIWQVTPSGGSGSSQNSQSTALQIACTSAVQIGFLGATPAIRQTGGAATAGAVYTATEQAMLQAAYDCLRTFGLLT